MSINKVVCELIPYGLKNTPLRIPIEDWNEVYTEMRHQAIANIPIMRLKKEFGGVVVEDWYNRSCANVVKFEHLLRKQRELLDLLQGAGFHPVIMKGYAAAIYYPDARMRSYGDVDFLVPEEEAQAAFRFMLDHGYQLSGVDGIVDYHHGLEKDNISFEIHNKPAGLNLLNQKSAKELYTRFQEACYKAELHRMNQYEIPVLPAAENGMVLLLHIANHMKSGLGLRHLIDWMEFCEHELTDEKYPREFKTLLQVSGLEQFAKVMTRTCQLYLGMERESITWCQCDDKLCRELMEYLFEQGNFGRKLSGDADKGTKVLAANTSPIDFMKHLQKRGLVKWKAARDHIWLRPFAWIYQLGNNLKRARAAGGLSYYIRSVRVGKKRKQFFKQLGI